MKKVERTFREKGIFLLLAGILCVYFAAICLINFSGRPSFYCTDMYTDMLFAEKAWEQKSLIPEGWLFGNQLYVVATPALAALFCSVASNSQIAMALAAVTMTAMILAAFYWMLSAVFSGTEERLLCIVLFMTLGLYFGDAVGTVNGWQLFFTMCAYYGCYLLNVLLAFGCYLRADGRVGNRFWVLLGITCVLSFGTGMQSLRQTAIMSGPLVGMVVLQLLEDLRKGKNWKRCSSLAAVLICLSNLAGLLFQKTVEFQQTEIFGQLGVAGPAQMLPAVGESIGNLLNLLHGETAGTDVMRPVVLIFAAGAAVELCVREKREENGQIRKLGVLLVLSVLAIFAIDVITTLKVREIYYFMFYLLLSFLLAYGFYRRKEMLRWLLVAAMVLTLVLPGTVALKDICMQAYFARYDPIHEVSDFLLEEGYDTVYAYWNQGERIAIASDMDIRVAFWDSELFVPVTYLCDPEVYEADSDRCVYALFGTFMAQLAEQEVAGRGMDFTLIRHFPNSDIYLYTSSENLMQVFAGK